jgi:hypothetical protein
MAAQSLILACSSTPQAVAGTFANPSVHGVIRIRLKSLAGTAYLGDSGVTTAGYSLTSADAAIQEVLMAGESLWAASSSGATVSLAILRTNETS